MKKFEYTQDFGEHKKGDVVEYDKETYHGSQHPLIMRGILRVIEKDSQPVEKESELDLTHDGKVDSEDARIAGKVLANQKYKGRK